MSPYTVWKYWHGDSVLKQTLMLLDKSGMRKRPKQDEQPKEKKGGFKQKKMSPEEARKQAIQTALKYGIGYEQYKKEVDAIRAAQIRARLEAQH